MSELRKSQRKSGSGAAGRESTRNPHAGATAKAKSRASGISSGETANGHQNTMSQSNVDSKMKKAANVQTAKPAQNVSNGGSRRSAKFKKNGLYGSASTLLSDATGGSQAQSKTNLKKSKSHSSSSLAHSAANGNSAPANQPQVSRQRSLSSLHSTTKASSTRVKSTTSAEKAKKVG